MTEKSCDFRQKQEETSNISKAPTSVPGTHLAHYLTNAWSTIPRDVMQPRRENDLSRAPNVGVKNKWSYTSNPPHVFMASRGTILLFTLKVTPLHACFQDSAGKHTRTAHFWSIRQRIVVIPYRRFGTTIFRGLLGFLTLEYRNDKLYQNVGKKLPPLAA
jgi:hypothetical protein